MSEFLKPKRRAKSRFLRAPAALMVAATAVGLSTSLAVNGDALATQDDKVSPVVLEPVIEEVLPGAPVAWNASVAPSDNFTFFYLPGVVEEAMSLPTDEADTPQSDGDDAVAAVPATLNSGEPIQLSEFNGSFTMTSATLFAAGSDISATGAMLCTDSQDPAANPSENEWSTECGPDTTAILVQGTTEREDRELTVELQPTDNSDGDTYVLSADPKDGALLQGASPAEAELTQSVVTVSEDAPIPTGGAASTQSQSGEPSGTVPAPAAGGGIEPFADGLDAPRLEKTAAKVNCDNPADPQQTLPNCTITWNITIENADAESLMGTFVDSTSQQVYDVEAKIKPGGGGGGTGGTCGSPALEVISAGYDHTLAIREGGTVYAWGNNEYGQLGRGTTGSSVYAPNLPGESYWSPQQVQGLQNVVQVAAGGSHSLAVTSSGAVYAWGDNTYGQLGLGNRGGPVTRPALITGLSNVKQVSANQNYSVAVTHDGNVYTWGSNQYGVLGNGQKGEEGQTGTGWQPGHLERVSPGLVTNLSGVAQVSAGTGHVLALQTEAAGCGVYAWGKGDMGQLGIAGAYDSYKDRLNPTRVPGLSNVMQVSAGHWHSVGLTAGGAVYSWGYGANGELGNGNASFGLKAFSPTLSGLRSGVAQVSAGGYFTLAVTTNNSVYGWGANLYGQVGNGVTAPTVSSPALSGQKALQVAASKGPVFQWGMDVRSSDRYVVGFGNDKYGQLGRGYRYDNTGAWVYPAPAPIQSPWPAADITQGGGGGSTGGSGASCPTGNWMPLDLGSEELNSFDPGFEQRTYTAADANPGTNGNGWLDMDAGCKVQIQITGKLVRGYDSYVVGNQAWYESNAFPRESPDMSEPLPGPPDDLEKWGYGKWTGNDTCTGGENSCDQVWAQVPNWHGGASISGTVWDATDGSVTPAANGTDGVPGVMVRVTGGGVDYRVGTDTKGFYSFGISGPGTYTVTFEKPKGYKSFLVRTSNVCPDGGKSCVNAAGQTPGIVLPNPNGLNNYENVNAGLIGSDTASITVEKGWWDGTQIRDSVIAYEDAWTEQITVKAKNDGDTDITDLKFTDTTLVAPLTGGDVSWDKCEVDGTAKTVSLPEKPDDGFDLGFGLLQGETMTCTGVLELKTDSSSPDYALHRDAVTVEGTGGVLGRGTFDLELEPTKDDLEAAKGKRTGPSTIVSELVMAQGANEDIDVLVTNNSGGPLANLTMTDTTIEGPDVTDWNCEAPINKETGELATGTANAKSCRGQFVMSGERHEDEALVIGINADGDVLKAKATFVATSELPDYPEASLPRAGMLGIWGAVLIGGTAFLAAFGATFFVGRPAKAYAKRH